VIVIAFVLALLSVEMLVVGVLIRRTLIRVEQPPRVPFDHERWFRRESDEERIGGVVERVRAARGVIAHPCSDGGELIEYPVHSDFDEHDVLATLAEIEAL
jgi:hypothetical protein